MDLDLCLGPQRQKSSWNGESGEAEGRNLTALDKPTHGNKAQLSSPQNNVGAEKNKYIRASSLHLALWDLPGGGGAGSRCWQVRLWPYWFMGGHFWFFFLNC